MADPGRVDAAVFGAFHFDHAVVDAKAIRKQRT
jgi:hypothetical protein